MDLNSLTENSLNVTIWYQPFNIAALGIAHEHLMLNTKETDEYTFEILKWELLYLPKDFSSSEIWTTQPDRLLGLLLLPFCNLDKLLILPASGLTVKKKRETYWLATRLSPPVRKIVVSTKLECLVLSTLSPRKLLFTAQGGYNRLITSQTQVLKLVAWKIVYLYFTEHMSVFQALWNSSTASLFCC